MLVFGICLVMIGPAFMLVPDIALDLFVSPTTNEPWVRVAVSLETALPAAAVHLNTKWGRRMKRLTQRSDVSAPTDTSRKGEF
jgi:hypothetical protein